MLEDAILDIEKLLLDPFAYHTALHVSVDENNKMRLKIKDDEEMLVSLAGDDLIDLLLKAGQDAKAIVEG